MQAQAGASTLQIFDTWANALTYTHFREFSLPYLDRMVRGVVDLNVPVILFCRGSSVFASDLVNLLPAAISVDWNSSLPTLRRKLGPAVSLQGNLDPHALLAPREALKQEVTNLLDAMKHDPGYIFNLGHGILPNTPVDAVHTLIECVKG
jgi:uroporphyrinogen decarboxylase